jgi:hypothetical protein
MGAFFSAGRRVWRPGRGSIPAGLAVLAIAGLDPFSPFTPSCAVAVLGLLAWLALERPTQRRPDAPQRFPTGLFAFALLALVLAAGIAIVLPLAQPFVERAAAEMLSSGQGQTGLSGTTRLGELQDLGLSREVALRVWSDRPLRLRGHALTRFDGRSWTEPVGQQRPLPRAARGPEDPLGARVAELPGDSFSALEHVPPDSGWARFLLVSVEPGLLVTPAGPRLVRIAGGVPRADPAGVLTAPFWPPPRLYGVAFGPGRPASGSAAERAAALQLPESLDQRLRDLARQLGEEASGSRERLERTVAWIGRHCEYDLNAGAFRSDEPVAEFLFEKRRGYCEYFASSAALLLRLQGIPTRFVKGFNVRDRSRRGGYYLVRAGDAHAWIESWIEGVGWVEADPTPAARFDALRAGFDDGALARVMEALAAFLAELQARFSADGGNALRWLAGRLAPPPPPSKHAHRPVMAKSRISASTLPPVPEWYR